MSFPLRTRTRGRPSRNAGTKLVAAAPSFDPLTGWTTDPVHAVWASDPSWSAPADGGAVSSWRNGGSVGGDLVQATGSKQPLYRASTAAFNSKPTVQFDGTNDVLSPASSIADLSQWSAVIVAQFTDLTTRVLLGGGTATSLFGTNASSQWYARWDYISASVAADTNAHLFRVQNITAQPNAFVDEGASVAGLFAGMADLFLGGLNATPSSPMAGHIALMLIFTTNPTLQTEWADFVAWVESHYGIPLP